jgi:hypothetical protein
MSCWSWQRKGKWSRPRRTCRGKQIPANVAATPCLPIEQGTRRSGSRPCQPAAQSFPPVSESLRGCSRTDCATWPLSASLRDHVRSDAPFCSRSRQGRVQSIGRASTTLLICCLTARKLCCLRLAAKPACRTADPIYANSYAQSRRACRCMEHQMRGTLFIVTMELPRLLALVVS